MRHSPLPTTTLLLLLLLLLATAATAATTAVASVAIATAVGCQHVPVRSPPTTRTASTYILTAPFTLTLTGVRCVLLIRTAAGPADAVMP